jgi:hypothetical protein
VRREGEGETQRAGRGQRGVGDVVGVLGMDVLDPAALQQRHEVDDLEEVRAARVPSSETQGRADRAEEGARCGEEDREGRAQAGGREAARHVQRPIAPRAHRRIVHDVADRRLEGDEDQLDAGEEEAADLVEDPAAPQPRETIGDVGDLHARSGRRLLCMGEARSERIPSASCAASRASSRAAASPRPGKTSSGWRRS